MNEFLTELMGGAMMMREEPQFPQADELVKLLQAARGTYVKRTFLPGELVSYTPELEMRNGPQRGHPMVVVEMLDHTDPFAPQSVRQGGSTFFRGDVVLLVMHRPGFIIPFLEDSRLLTAWDKSMMTAAPVAEGPRELNS